MVQECAIEYKHSFNFEKNIIIYYKDCSSGDDVFKWDHSHHSCFPTCKCSVTGHITN